MNEGEDLEPLSPYARWKLEEDERFYATFPQARAAAQQYNTISSAYLVGTGYYYDTDGRIARSDEPTYYCNDSSSSYSTYDDGAASLPPPPISNNYHHASDYKSSDLARALDPTSRDGATRSSASPPNLYNVAPLPQPSLVEIAQASVIVPSQQPPVMGSLPSLSLSNASSSYAAHNVISKSEYPSMAYVDPSMYYIHAHPRSYNFYPSTSQPGWPVIYMPSRSIRLSPLPSKRTIAKKPPLACLFCRGRKIACGPPDAGSSDRSCK
ncbi:hypothetical protein C0991_002729 [Blastosporella zonata]|nr:hypothetical protein C0991_002729 [Blastosporella zonata]